MSWKKKKLDGMDDEDLCDVHLVGTDGEEVPCCKTFLASTSPVFKSMFFRGFKEQKTDRCSLNFHSLVIKLVVKYCYCGEVDMDLIFSTNKSVEEEATLLVELREAGRYFEIEDLSSAAEAKIGNLVFHRNNDNKKYRYTSAFLTELFERGEDKEPLGFLLFQLAVKNTMECFGAGAAESDSTGMYQAHPIVLSNVLAKHEDIYTVVKCLQTWSFLENKSAGNFYTDEEKRNLIAIARNVDLKRLPTGQLSNLRPCSLFSSERILEAFIHQCKSPEIITETPSTTPRLHVSGAAMEHINGKYRQTPYHDGRILNVFYHKVRHNGVSCYALIHRKHKERKWLVSIAKEGGRLGVNSEDDVDEGYFQMHIYESLPTEDPKLPPFNGWKCVEGTGQVPFVACIYE